MGFYLGCGGGHYMFSIMAEAKAAVPSLVAPGRRRSRS